MPINEGDYVMVVIECHFVGETLRVTDSLDFSGMLGYTLDTPHASHSWMLINQLVKDPEVNNE